MTDINQLQQQLDNVTGQLTKISASMKELAASPDTHNLAAGRVYLITLCLLAGIIGAVLAARPSSRLQMMVLPLGSLVAGSVIISINISNSTSFSGYIAITIAAAIVSAMIIIMRKMAMASHEGRHHDH